MSDFTVMCVQTLVVTNAPNPSVLVLCPQADFGHARTCRVVPIWMGWSEAQQLGAALEGQKFPRPMTHDLFLDAITNLDAVVDQVAIVRKKGNTFFASLTLRQGERVLQLDARPSDAIALAIRQGATILMADEVLAAASFPFIFKGQNDEEELQQFHAFVETLQPEDFAAAPPGEAHAEGGADE